MRRLLILLLLVPTAAAVAQDPAPAGVAAEGRLDLMFYDDRPTDGTPRTPTFKVTADMKLSTEGPISFTDATAVIYGADGRESRITAQRGTFDRATGRAELAGTVALESGTLRASLENISWDNAARTARSDSPVTLSDTGTSLSAASFVFRPEGEEVILTGVSGTVGMGGTLGEETGVAAKPDALDTMTIRRAGELRMASRRVSGITGGVDIEVSASGGGAEPVRLDAAGATFAYSGRSLAPDEVALSGGVAIEAPMGRIQSDTAVMRVADNTFRFSGNVRGSAPDIESFRADSLVYAPGLLRLDGNVAVKAEAADVKAGSAELRESDGVMILGGGVTVESPDATIQAARGRVDRKSQRMLFEGDVHLVSRKAGAAADLHAQRAELNEATKQMIFTGGVSGDLADIRGVRAGTVTYSIESGDMQVSDLTIDSFSLGEPSPAVGDSPPPPAGGMPGAGGFSSMAITRAPEVQLAARRLERITGGIEITLTPADPAAPPMVVRGDEATFAYEGDGMMPRDVTLTGDVFVEGEVGAIRSAQAVFSPASRAFMFSGGVTGSTPQVSRFSADTFSYGPEGMLLDGTVRVESPEGVIAADRARMEGETGAFVFEGEVQGGMPRVKGMVADKLVYHPGTGELTMEGARIAEWTLGGDDDHPFFLRDEDITDWPGWISALKRQGLDPAPSPGRRILVLLDEPVRLGLYRLRADAVPNESARDYLRGKINALLRDPDLHEPAAWAGVPLSPDTAALLARPRTDRTPDDTVRMNRRLLEAAFPGIIEARTE